MTVRSSQQISRQITPIRVRSLDQPQLGRPRTALELLLPRDRRHHRGMRFVDPLLVVCPHPQDLDDAFAGQDLIDKAMLNVDPARECAFQVANQLLKGWWSLERVTSE